MVSLFYIDGSYVTVKVMWAPGVVPLNDAEFEAFINAEDEINVVDSDDSDDSDLVDASDIFILIHDDD